MFVGIGLFNLFNLLYHLFMVRTLPPAEYGHLNALLSLFMIISVPSSTVQTTITKFVSSFQVQYEYHRIRELLRHFLLLMSIIAFSFFLLLSFGGPILSSFFQISSYRVVFLLGLALFFAMVIPVPWGGLQGLHKFGSLASNLIMNGILKFALGILFIYLGWGISGAMGAIVLSYFVTTFFALLMLGIHLPRREGIIQKDKNPKGLYLSYFSDVYHYFLTVGMTMLCFILLTNIDLILVKHFFKPVEAGYYSIAQMVGKIILFLPLPIIMVMFPKLSSLEAQGRKTLSTLMRSLIIGGVISILALIFGLLFPSLLIRILSGKVYLECVPLVKIFSVNMTFFALTLILLYYHLSTHGTRFLYPLISLTLIQTGLIALFHKTLIQVLFIVGGVALSLFIANLFLIYKKPVEYRSALLAG